MRGSGALFDACGSVLVFAAEKGEPTRVSHEKARISGRPHPDFGLWIEDVEVDGDPTAGLRVTALDAPASERESDSTRLDKVKGRVLDHIREQGPVAGGVEAIRIRLGARKADVGAALSELAASGAITRGGTTRHPVYALGNRS